MDPNVGIVFSTPQTIKGVAPLYLKTGYISFYIRKENANDEISNITAQYLHKGFSLSSFSISSAGISYQNTVGDDYLSDCDIVSVRS